MGRQVEFHFKHLGLSGETLVVVAVGTQIYGACALDPLTALRAAAWRASEDLANRRQPIDPRLLIESGEEELRARFTVEGAEPRSPSTFPREAA